MRYLECKLLIEVHCQPQLVVKLFRKGAASKTVSDAGDKLSMLFRVYVAMFQAAAHHGPCSTVPKPLRFREDKLDAFVDRANFFQNEAVGKLVKITLR